MNASQELQLEVGASLVPGLGGLRLAAAVLAAVGAGMLAPPAATQTFPITIDMNAGGAVVPLTVTVPDPFAVAEQALGCEASAGCLADVLQGAAPALGQFPPVPAPPAPPGPAQPEEPAGPPPNGGSQAAPGPPAAPAARPPRGRSPAPERASPAIRPALAEIVAPPPSVEEPVAPRPLPAPEVAPRGSELLAEPASPVLPAALPGFDWSPLLLNMLLAAGSLALLLFLLMATPQHSMGHVSYWLADRRIDLGLLGAVMLVGLAVGYFIATSIG